MTLINDAICTKRQISQNTISTAITDDTIDFFSQFFDTNGCDRRQHFGKWLPVGDVQAAGVGVADEVLDGRGDLFWLAGAGDAKTQTKRGQ